MTETFTDDIHLLLATLPEPLQRALDPLPKEDLLEIVMDLGRPPLARYPVQAQILSPDLVSALDIDHVVGELGEFGDDNRAGIPGTLHRISAIRNRKGRIVGLTLRIGRAVSGTVELIRDLAEKGTSILLLGRPGIGKTTKLREVARLLADELGKRVIVIDTSNEIAGDGDIPHPAIGGARRMQVPHTAQQHAVMIEAVENHMPEVIVIDEIGTLAETMAARTIAERGVQLIGTAHGNTLENLVSNPTLSDLVGGVQTVTLGDEEARLRGTQKTISERKAPPTFDAVVEIVGRDEVIVHPDTAKAVDRLLRGANPGGERRSATAAETVETRPRTMAREELPEAAVSFQPGPGQARILAYAMSRDLVERVIRDLRLEARTVKTAEQADMILALRSRADDVRLGRMVDATGLPVFLVRKNSTAQIRNLLQSIFTTAHGLDDEAVATATAEAQAAIERVTKEGGEVALSPQPASLRQLQHRLAVRHHLVAESVGSEPRRHIVIHA